MNTMVTIIVVIQVLSALTIIGLVLLQHGKGADMGAAFGSGASGSLFGATGSSNFLSKSTGFAAAIFFGATLALAFFGNHRTAATGGVMDNLPVAPVPTVPAAPLSTTTPGVPVPAGATPTPAAPVTAPTTVPTTAPSAAPAAPVAPANASGQASQIPK
ncbi:MAG: preprotein translocase subunit SecG [Herminiimonas sp.]|nr:preprotein translocase subunit SecG [Herminiimonas sp.]